MNYAAFLNIKKSSLKDSFTTSTILPPSKICYSNKIMMIMNSYDLVIIFGY